MSAGTRKKPRLGSSRWYREWLLRLRGDLCCFCGLVMTRPTLEHVLPRAKGGTTRMSNLSLSHATCNRARGCRPFWEWRERQQRRYQRLLPDESHVLAESPRSKPVRHTNVVAHDIGSVQDDDNNDRYAG